MVWKISTMIKNDCFNSCSYFIFTNILPKESWTFHSYFLFYSHYIWAYFIVTVRHKRCSNYNFPKNQKFFLSFQMSSQRTHKMFELFFYLLHSSWFHKQKLWHCTNVLCPQIMVSHFSEIFYCDLRQSASNPCNISFFFFLCFFW